MASIIRIKRSSVAGNPSVLGAGELAYSALTNNDSNGGDRLYIGIGAETAGDAANHIVIGGKYFTDLLDHTRGTLTASSALIVDATSKLDNLKVDNLDLNGNTISTTNTNGDILLTPNGTGKTVITNAYIGDTSTTLAEFIYDTVGGAVTGGTGITITNNDAGNTSTISLTNTSVTFGSTTVALGSSSTAIAGVTQLDVDNIRIDGNIISSTNTNGNISLDPNGTGTVEVNNSRITGVAEPTQATDAATKNYVDAVKTGLKVKDAVRVATAAALTATYANGTSGVGATLTNSGTQAALTVDSIALSVGERVLVKDQASAFQNGIYTVTTVGTVSTNWVLTRATDADSNSPVAEVEGGDFCFVQEGTTNGDNGFVVTTNGAIVIGTTGIDWVQFSGAGQVIAGDGLTKTGNTVNAVGTLNRISITADAIDIASTYVGQTSITTLGTIATGVWQGTIVGPTYGGTGVNNGTKTITLGGNFTHTGAHTLGLTTSANTSVTLPTTGTLATLAGSETFTNKTLTAPVIATIVNTGTLTLPTSTDTLVGRATTDTLTNKTITGAVITTGSINNTPIGATTTNTGAFTTLAASGAVTLTSATDASAIGTAAVVLTGGLSVAKSMFVGINITGAGAATSTLDGFNIDGGTY
jgi:hypothetical protein